MEGGDLFAAWQRFEVALETMETFEAGISRTIDDAPLDQLQSPLLNHIGIIDLNKAWEVASGLDKDKIAAAYPLVGNFPVYSARLELENEVFEKLGFERRAAISGNERVRDGLNKDFSLLQNEFYPIGEGSFIDSLAQTKLWRRILGIPQLNWKSNYPLENTHSRGAHSLFVAINMARVLQGLYDADAAMLAERLKRDFTDAPFYAESMTDEEVMLLAVDLAVLVAMTHDIYTPAGGDMMKHVMDMDEEADASNLLEEGDERVQEFVEVLERRGLHRGHLRFVVDCIQGNSFSLVGEMIHSERGDILEQDRLAYTVQDHFSAGILGPAIARELIDDSSLHAHEDALIAATTKASVVLRDGDTYVVGTLSSEYSAPSLSLLDVSDDYVLNGDLELVCTRPDKLLWLAVLRALFSAEFYQGAKLRGQEHELHQALTDAIESGAADAVLNKENLQRVTNSELHRQLHLLGGVALNDMLADIDEMFFTHRYKSEVVPIDADSEDAWFSFKVSIKPGLDTLVIDNGEGMTLGAYMDRHPESLATRLLLHTMDTYHGKKRVVQVERGWVDVEDCSVLPKHTKKG